MSLRPVPEDGAVPSAASARLFVGSEVAPLRRVIVHRPGHELRRLTPENKAQLLFDDLVWVDRAAEEHDELTDALRTSGVEVLYLHDLLAETLTRTAARKRMIAATTKAAKLGPTLGRELAAWLSSLAPEEMASRLIAGVTYDELPMPTTALTAQISPPEALALTPLANHMFTRDASAWVFNGVSLHRMARPARRRETLHFELIYRHHPMFAGAEHEIWSDRLGAAPELEGGDILVLGNSSLLIGVGQRTKASAVEHYARRLFVAGAAERVVVAVLPHSRATIHIDSMLTMVDWESFVGFPSLCRLLDAYVLTPHRSNVRAQPAGDLLDAIARAMGLSAVRLIHSNGDRITTEQEQWHEAGNVLAIAPGTVIAYERNEATNSRLHDCGIEVIAVPGSELSRGRGGPRCLTCPIERAPSARLTAV